MHREKIEKLQADLSNKTEEVKKLKSRITTLKNNMAKIDMLNKKPVQIVLKPGAGGNIEDS